MSLPHRARIAEKAAPEQHEDTRLLKFFTVGGVRSYFNATPIDLRDGLSERPAAAELYQQYTDPDTYPIWYTRDPADFDTNSTIHPLYLTRLQERLAGCGMPSELIFDRGAKFDMHAFTKGDLFDLRQVQVLYNFINISYEVGVAPGRELRVGPGHRFPSMGDLAGFLNSRDQDEEHCYNIAFTVMRGWNWKCKGNFAGIPSRGASFKEIFNYFQINPIAAADGCTVVGFRFTVKMDLTVLYKAFLPTDDKVSKQEMRTMLMHKVMPESYAPNVTVAAPLGEASNYAQMGFRHTAGATGPFDYPVMAFEPIAFAAAVFCKNMHSNLNDVARSFFGDASPCWMPDAREAWYALFPQGSRVLRAL